MRDWLIVRACGSFDALVYDACQRLGVSRAVLLGRCRTQKLAFARQDIMLRMMDGGASYAEVGRLMGFDHTTIIYGVRSARKRRAKPPPAPPAPPIKATRRAKAPAPRPPHPFTIAFTSAFGPNARYG